MKKSFILLSFVILAILSCSKKNTKVAEIDCSTPKSFATDASPVFQASCSYNSSCHGTGSSKKPGALVTYTQIYNNRSAIRSSVMSGYMPGNGNLSSSALSAIVCWIDAGAANN